MAETSSNISTIVTTSSSFCRPCWPCVPSGIWGDMIIPLVLPQQQVLLFFQILVSVFDFGHCFATGRAEHHLLLLFSNSASQLALGAMDSWCQSTSSLLWHRHFCHWRHLSGEKVAFFYSLEIHMLLLPLGLANREPNEDSQSHDGMDRRP